MEKKEFEEEMRKIQDNLLMEFFGFDILVPSGETVRLSTAIGKIFIADFAGGETIAMVDASYRMI